MGNTRILNKRLILAIIVLSFLLFVNWTYGLTGNDVQTMIDNSTDVDDFKGKLVNNGYSYIQTEINDGLEIMILDDYKNEVEITGDNPRTAISGLGSQTLNWSQYEPHDDIDKAYFINSDVSSPIVQIAYNTNTETIIDSSVNEVKLKVSWSGAAGDDLTRYGTKIDLDSITEFETNNSDIKAIILSHSSVNESQINYTGTYPTEIEKPTTSQINNFSYMYARNGKRIWEVVSHRPVDPLTNKDYIRYEYFVVNEMQLPYVDSSIYSNGNQYSGESPITYLDYTGNIKTDLDGLRYWHPNADELISSQEFNSEGITEDRPREYATILNMDDIALTELPDDDSQVTVQLVGVVRDEYGYYDYTINTNYIYEELPSQSVTESYRDDVGVNEYSKIKHEVTIDLTSEETGYFQFIYGDKSQTLTFTNDGQMSYFTEQELENLLNPNNNTMSSDWTPNQPDTILGWVEYYGGLLNDLMTTITDSIKNLAYELSQISKLIGLVFQYTPNAITSLIILSLAISVVKMARG